jgi:hypothetical protein
MHVYAVAVSQSSRPLHANNSTNESRKPMLPSEVRNVSSRNDGWSTGTKVALGVTGAVIGVGTFIAALGTGNPVAGAVVVSGLFTGIAKPFSSQSNVSETLPVPEQQMGALVPPASPIDACNLLVATTSALNARRIGDISLTELRSVERQVAEVSVTNLSSLNAGQLSELGRCFGRDLMAAKVLFLKTRLEDAKRDILEGRSETLIGQLSDQIFQSIGIVRKNMLLREIDPRLSVVNEIHAKLRSFVLAINDRILSNIG